MLPGKKVDFRDGADEGGTCSCSQKQGCPQRMDVCQKDTLAWRAPTAKSEIT